MNSPFQAWFKENKDSDVLIDSYREYKHNMEQAGEVPLSFRDWALGEFQED
jgi:hypothetical protein